MFNSAYIRSECVYSANKSGTAYIQPFKLVYLSNGCKSFVMGNKVPLNDLIQSHKDECDIKTIIARCIAKDGNLDALKARKEDSLDLTLFPRDVKEYQNFVRSSREAYDKLSPSVKAQFSSFKDFCENTGKVSEFYSKLAENAKKTATKDIETKKGDEK